MGKKKMPFYRVVVADIKSPRDGRFIENIGTYDPHKDPVEINIEEEKALYWLSMRPHRTRSAASCRRSAL
jgi:small subunit ribosomal protein S16